MATKQNRKNTKNPKHKLFSVRKIALVAGAIAIIVGVVGVIALRRGDDAATKMHTTFNTPTAATFTDSGNVMFTSDNIPDVNNARTLSHIQPLVISYNWTSGPYNQALRPDATNNDITTGVKISPFVRGTWAIRGGGDELAFTPDTDWPADTRFTVRVADNLVNSDVAIDDTTISFTTPRIAATVDSFNLYPAPNAKKSVIGVAVISFNYPIVTTEFNDKLTVKLDGAKLDFTVKFDKFRRTAIITTAPVQITNTDQIIRLKLNRVAPAAGNGATKKLTAHTTVAAADNIFKISDITTTAADDKNGNAQQLVLVNMTATAVANTDWGKYVEIYLLPKYKTDDEKSDETPHQWADDEITPDVITHAKKIPTKLVPFVNPTGVYQYAFSYDVSVANRFIFVRVASGFESTSGFYVKNGASRVLSVAYPVRTVKIAGSGALLSLAGDKKLGIMARGGATAAHVNLSKVKSSEINHLISQTYNIFSENIEFKGWSFSVDDMAVVFRKTIHFSDPSMTKTNYASIDLGAYLDRTGGDKTGIFVIQVAPDATAAQYSDRRLILLTNLGIIRKTNQNNSSTLFVVNLSDGTPAADTEINVLGRNGNAVWAGRTDNDGHTDIPELSWNEYRDAREPVAIVARRGDDVSFIPYNATAPMVDYSKFDVDGEYYYGDAPLNAFVFTDRGIYRAGEDMIAAGIVKNKSFKALAGIPVRAEITDPRGRDALTKTFTLAGDGMFDIKYTIPATAATGEWQVRLYSLDSRGRVDTSLGVATFRVADFVPDNMKITTTIAGGDTDGWISVDGMRANVSLRNLFGTAATDKRITASATLTPTNFTFDAFPDYVFTPNFISGTGLADGTARASQTFTANMPDMHTDDNGAATISINFDDVIPDGTYMLKLTTAGFESASGRSVRTTTTARVSNAKYLVGYHADGNLKYIARGAARNVKLVAVDHTGTAAAADNLTIRTVHRENLTSLVKDYSGYYKYQTVTRDKVIAQNALDIATDGKAIALDTANAGTYFVQILDSAERVLANIEYFVAGNENSELKSDTNAELKIKLSSNSFAAGDKIDVSITAPYTGAGLITIERDRVYAYKWFNTNTTTSVQQITLPDGFEGTGYVNVSFVRDITSRDIFTTPYAYAVAPFATKNDVRKIGVKLTTPDVVRDHKLPIKYETDSNARLMIFAVNTGILQVAKYDLPRPLAYFFKKAALQVSTYQTLSLLLPEYKILREFAKTGGGDFESDADVGMTLSNPFGRRTLPPVAFYSGIIDTQAGQSGEITFNLPEYFNGALRVFAVAANTTAVGSADTNVRVQSPVMITLSAPLVAAPNDTFDIGAVVSNQVAHSGASATADISLSTSDGLTPVATTGKIAVPENNENVFTTSVRVGDVLGNADIKLNATITGADDASGVANATASLSVRPITTFTTRVHSGTINAHTAKIRGFHIDMYPEFSARTLYVSPRATVLARPLVQYLAHYEFPCTEQLVSRALPYVVAPNDDTLGTNFDESSAKIADTIRQLQSRQNINGAFELWATTDSSPTPATATSVQTTAYVAQFLTLARDAGFNVPKDMLGRAIGFLRDFAGTPIDSNDNAVAVAHAIFVITQNDYITTNYINLFQEYADKNIKNWQRTISGAYIAAAYKMMKQDDAADKLIAQYRTTSPKFEYASMYDNNVANDAMYNFISRRYFDTTAGAPDSVVNYVAGGDYSSYTSAMATLALIGNATTTDAPTVTISANSTEITGTTSGDTQTFDIPTDATAIDIKCEKCDRTDGMYYALVQTGYPRATTESSNGISVSREYYNENGERITSANIGDRITVRVFARARTGDVIQNVAITDLLPAGFSVEAAVTGNQNFAQIREDRVVIFTDLTRTSATFEYTADVTAAGTFSVPPIHAESMYNPSVNATGATSTFTVSNGEQ